MDTFLLDWATPPRRWARVITAMARTGPSPRLTLPHDGPTTPRANDG